MAVRICTQEPLKKLLDNESMVEISGATVSEVFKKLQARYPRFAERMLERDGSVRRFVNVYVNEEDIRFLQNQQTSLRDGD
ncbi:MAG: molybdopterin synthase subunit MoaD, partial [Verrucomicrobiales bacterium]|nr:molybdopterin synthase subunit MoaD [Verrucomicrobiales bacterium]